MENNTNEKKNNFLYIIIAVIIVILAIVLLVSNKNKGQEPVLDQTDIEINNALSEDTTIEIQDNLNNIDVSDTTEQDLKEIDDELNKL